MEKSKILKLLWDVLCKDISRKADERNSTEGIVDND